MKAVQPLRDGKVAVRFNSRDQQEAVENRVGQAGNDITITTKGKARPKLTFTGVIAGYREDELLKMVHDENEDIRQHFGQAFITETRLVNRKKCRNDRRENVTIETNPEIFKHCMRKGQVYIDLAVVHVEEASQVVVCFNCHKFGHVRKYCTSPRTCHHCGGAHQGSDCRAKWLDCMNCRLAGMHMDDRRHNARDKNCPIYKRKERIAREQTQYK